MVRRPAPPGARDRAGQVEPLPGSGDADVGKPAFLLELAFVVDRALVREDVLLHAGEEDDGKLQSLGGVQRHQRDHAAVIGSLWYLVGIGHQRDLLKEGGQATINISAIEFPGNRNEFVEVLDASGVLQVGRCLKLGDIAGAVENRLHNVADRRALIGRRPELGNHLVEAFDRPDRPGRQRWHVGRPRQSLRETNPVLCCLRRDVLERAVANATARHVDDTAQRDLVLRVGDEPQVGEQVTDLSALVEPDAADHLVRHAGPDEHLFEHARLGVGPVEDRHLARRRVGGVAELVHLFGDERGLVVLAVGDVADDQRAGPGL